MVRTYQISYGLLNLLFGNHSIQIDMQYIISTHNHTFKYSELVLYLNYVFKFYKFSFMCLFFLVFQSYHWRRYSRNIRSIKDVFYNFLAGYKTINLLQESNPLGPLTWQAFMPCILIQKPLKLVWGSGSADIFRRSKSHHYGYKISYYSQWNFL